MKGLSRVLILSMLLGMIIPAAAGCYVYFSIVDGKQGHSLEKHITDEQQQVAATIQACLDQTTINEQVGPQYYQIRNMLLRTASAQFVDSEHQPISTGDAVHRTSFMAWLSQKYPMINPAAWNGIMDKVDDCHQQNASELTIVRNDAQSFRGWIRSAPIYHVFVRPDMFPDKELKVSPSLTGQQALDYLTEVIGDPDNPSVRFVPVSTS